MLVYKLKTTKQQKQKNYDKKKTNNYVKTALFSRPPAAAALPGAAAKGRLPN